MRPCARAIAHVALFLPARGVVAVGEDDHLPRPHPLQLVDAGVDGVVETRRVAELQILQRADEGIAIVGEPAAELDLVAEGADLALVIREHPEHELLGAALSSPDSPSCCR